MRQVSSCLVVACGLLTLACATAFEEGPLGRDFGDDTGGSAGSLNTSGTPAIAGRTGMASAGMTGAGGKGGTGSTAFGGTASGGATGGSASGGKAGVPSGGNAGTASGGSGTSGSASGGIGTAGSPSTTCNGVPNWTPKTYAVGDSVASTCSGVFAGACPTGQPHKFECNPAAGGAALPWCQSREPGVGNGWSEAWLDKGECQ